MWFRQKESHKLAHDTCMAFEGTNAEQLRGARRTNKGLQQESSGLLQETYRMITGHAKDKFVVVHDESIG